MDERVEQQVDGEKRQLDDQHQGVPELGQSHSFDRRPSSVQWTVHCGQSSYTRAAAELEQARPPPRPPSAAVFLLFSRKTRGGPYSNVCSPCHSRFRPVNIEQRTTTVGNKYL